jgi:hypothetical protein
MAVDIAQLGIEVDSNQVRTASDRLDGLRRSAGPAEKSVRDVGRAGEIASGGMGRLQKGILAAAAAATTLIVAFASANGLSRFIKNTIQADAVQAQLAAAIKSTGGAANQTQAALNAHAAALQKVTNFGDETINSAQGLLLTFTRISGDIFPKATTAVLNVATAMQTDLKSAAIQVGKALNDPVLGLTTLSRSGITFSETQKELVKQLVETGQTVKAQEVILAELETQFGGSAAAARTTLGGALTSLGNAFGDLFELSSRASEPLRLAIEGLIVAIQNPAFVDFVQTIGTGLFKAATSAVNVLALLSNNLDVLGQTLAVLAATQLPRVAVGLGAATAGAGALRVALAALGGPLGLIAGGLALVFANADKLDALSSDLFGGSIGPARRLAAATDEIVKSMGDEITQVQILSGVLNSGTAVSVGAANQKLIEAKSRFENVKAAVAEQRALALSSESYAQLTTKIRQAQGVVDSQGFSGIDAAVPRRAEAFENAQQALADLIAARQALLEGDKALNDAAATAEQNVALLDKAIAAAKGGLVTFGEALVLPTTKTNELSQSQQEAVDKVREVIAALREEVDTFDLTNLELEKHNRLTEAGVAAGSEQGRVIAELVEQLEAKRRAQQADDVIQSLREEIDLLLLTNQERERYNILREAGAAAGSAEEAEIIRLDELRTKIEGTQRVTEELRDASREVFDGIIRDIQNGASATDILLGALESILQKFLDIAAVSGSGGGGGGGLFGSLFQGLIGVLSGSAAPTSSPLPVPRPSALGNVFSDGNIVPFARGGVVREPTIFPFANGIGLMSEKEPEAIMPLRRTSSGRLGVEVAGGGGVGGGGSGQNTFFIDARGTDSAAIARLEKALNDSVGPGKVERRAVAAVVETRRRKPSIFGRG